MFAVAMALPALRNLSCPVASGGEARDACNTMRALVASGSAAPLELIEFIAYRDGGVSNRLHLTTLERVCQLIEAAPASVVSVRVRGYVVLSRKRLVEVVEGMRRLTLRGQRWALVTAGGTSAWVTADARGPFPDVREPDPRPARFEADFTESELIQL